MTRKQRRFIELKAMGLPNKDAAIQAGYAPNSADVSAGKLMMRGDILDAIKEAQTSSGQSDNNMPRDHYPDALTFLMDVMNHHALPVGMRIDAARHLLPYQHARLGEQGKKQKRQDEADKMTKGGKFQTGKAPKLHAIDGGKPLN